MRTLADEIADLKNAIQMDVQRRVNEFKAQTGLTPARIEIDMLDSTTYGDAVQQRIVGNVTIGLGDF